MSASQAEIVSPNPKMSAESQAVIRTVDLTKVYPGGVKAVDTLNLTVAQGEIFGLLGPNGAGKTTTASMLTTRVIPTSGQAFIADVDVLKHPAVAKQLIGSCLRRTRWTVH
jgi:ABC-2 type transport system ATP-binding protein